MKCPKCKGKAIVKNNAHDDVYNVSYRRYECKECGKIFYTSEMQDSKKLFMEIQVKKNEEYKKRRENKSEA